MKKKLIMAGIALPFIVLIIWILSGVFGGSETNLPARKGLNTELPGVRGSKDSAMDKLGFYAAAQVDSVKHEEALRMDPNLLKPDTAEMIEREILVQARYGTYFPASTGNDQLEETVRAIQKQLSVKEEPVTENRVSGSITRLQAAPDPELEAINATIDKLMLLQHPETAKPVKENKGDHSLPVLAIGKSEENYFGRQPGKSTAIFFDDNRAEQHANVLTASIPEEQVLQSGSVVHLQLNQPVRIGGVTVPAQAHLYGMTKMEGERLLVRISSVGFNKQILPVSLSVYDLDGIEGIAIPGSLSREVAKATADQSLQSINVLSLDAGISSQAAAAGIGAMKNLLSKKVKAVRVTVIAGYQVYLRDNH